jgi:hypothetical protein
VRYRTLGCVAVKGAGLSFLADFAAFLPVGTWTQAAIDWVTFVVFLMSCAALLTWVSLNLGVRPAREVPGPGRREEREEASARLAAAGQAMEALRVAMLAGTYSVNGQRYVSPHPVRARQPHLPVAGGRVVKSECDECGVPLDVAWCTPGTPYLCGRCSYPARVTW